MSKFLPGSVEDIPGRGAAVADVVIPVAEGDKGHAERVGAFKAALKERAGHPEGRLSIVREFITTGRPIGLGEKAYYQLRSTVASLYDLHPSAVIVVGSCRTGFSIARSEFKPRYRPFDAKSDIDVAIVSGELFDKFWDAAFAGQPSPEWVLSAVGARRLKNQPHHLARDLFNGCIVPEHLDKVRPLSLATDWLMNFDNINRSRMYGNYKLAGRLYRTWARLESYQDIMVTQCNAELMEAAK